jgi:hypothetical protein
MAIMVVARWVAVSNVTSRKRNPFGHCDLYSVRRARWAISVMVTGLVEAV